MVVILEGGCRVTHMHDGEPRMHGTLRLWNQIGRATGAQAISLRIMEFASGMSPAIQNDDCDQILYVVGTWKSTSDREVDLDREAVKESSQGQARSAPPLDPDQLGFQHPEGVREFDQKLSISINDQKHEVGRDTGIYVRPHETFAIDNPGPDPITIISSQCPDPDRKPLFVEPPLASSEQSNVDVQPMVRLNDRRAQPTADRWYRVMVDDEVGSSQATQFVGSIPPGRAPDHFHNYEEVLFILKGTGRMWAGATNTPIAAGSCIYLPQGQIHCVENTGEAELRLLGVFYPAGSPSVRYDV